MFASQESLRLGEESTLMWPLFQAFDEILKRANSGTLRSCPSNRPACANTVSAFEVQAGTDGMLMGQPDFPALFEVFAAALKGNGTAFTASSPQVDALWSIPLLCNDYRKSVGASKHGHRKALMMSRNREQDVCCLRTALPPKRNCEQICVLALGSFRYADTDATHATRSLSHRTNSILADSAHLLRMAAPRTDGQTDRARLSHATRNR